MDQSLTPVPSTFGNRPSRRTVLIGGLAFLAACSSSESATEVPEKIVLGAEGPPATADSGATATADTAAAGAGANDPAAPTPTPDPERVPIKSVSFTYLDGEPGRLSDLFGAPLVLNFFASWCAPCRKEMPEFEEIAQKYAGQVQFLGFSVLDDDETTRELLAQTGVTFPVAMDPDQAIHFDLGGFAMPTTILVDRFGNIAAGRAGAISGADLDALIQEEIL